MNIYFSLYGESIQPISFEDLMEREDCIARLENSGSEGYYCEIARWNPKQKTYQRYAFLKFLGGEILDLGAFENARYVTNTLNNKWYTHNSPLIHNLNDWESSPAKT